MENMEDKVKSHKKEQAILRGKRVKKLRSMAMLTIAEFAKELGRSRVGVSYWENASNNRALSKKGAKKVIALIQEKHNIECNFDWLWEGKGSGPRYLNDTSGVFFTSIEKEMESFQAVHDNAVIVKIESGKLWPYFMFNDLIAGVWRAIDTLQAEEFCIVSINNRDEVRWVKKINSHPAKLQISFSPSDEESAQEVTLEKIAPIMRIWRMKNS